MWSGQFIGLGLKWLTLPLVKVACFFIMVSQDDGKAETYTRPLVVAKAKIFIWKF